MAIKVLGISSSPSDMDGESNSGKLLAKLLSQVREYGGETERINLINLNIRPCGRCNNLIKNDLDVPFPCVHVEDDTYLVLQAIMSADALAVAFPVHWGLTPGDLSNLIQRMTVLEHERYRILAETGREPLLGKPVVFLASKLDEGASLATSPLSWAFSHLGFNILSWGMIYESSFLEKPAVRTYLRVMRETRFIWVENTIRLAARNLLLYAEHNLAHPFDDYEVKEYRT